METHELEFINHLTSRAVQAELAAEAERKTARSSAFDVALTLLAGEKDTIRSDTKVNVVEGKKLKDVNAVAGKGQGELIDTHRATRKGQGLTPEDLKKVGAKLKLIGDAARGVLEQTTSDGQPLFDSQAEFERAMTFEFFAPLVREQVLPDNFVISKYSEVQQLLDASFASYKKRNAGDRDGAAVSQAEEAGKFAGKSDGLDQFASKLKYLGSLPGQLVDKVGLNTDGRDNKGRIAGIVWAGAGAVKDAVTAGLVLSKWQIDPETGNPMAVESAANWLDPQRAGFDDADSDAGRVAMVQAKRDSTLQSLVSLGVSPEAVKSLSDLLDVKESLGVAVVDWTKDYLGDIWTLLKDAALPVKDQLAFKGALDSVQFQTTNAALARQAGIAIDAKLVELTDRHVRPGVGGALAGRYVSALDTTAIGEATSSKKPDDQAMVQAFAAAFVGVFASGHDAALAAAGQAVAVAFKSAAKGKALNDALRKAPATAFDPLILAAGSAIDSVLAKLDPTVRQRLDMGAMKAAMKATAAAIDAALTDGIKAAAGGDAAAAIEGLYAASVDIGAAAAAAAGTPADGAAIVRVYAQAFQTAFATCAPSTADTQYLDAGKAIGKALSAGADAGAIGSDLASGPAAALVPLVAAARAAVSSGLKGAPLLVSSLRDPATQRAIAFKAVMPDGGEQAMAQMEDKDESLQDYERQLVLIDEGGAAAAQFNTIEKLLAELERDELMCKMIIATGNALTGLAINTTGVVGWTTEAVSDVLVGEIAGPLKAAKLIIKFGVAMKKAYERVQLFRAMRANLKRAKNAGSPLQSAIQGLFDNKVEQITFRAIEDALTLVQIASAVLGSVPEPFTLAAAKTMSATAGLADSALTVSEMIYNEAQLSKGWDTTLAAINNPQDRDLGMRALQLNPTLAMHAIAWAGMERQPTEPTARMLLADLGLNEQTLAAGGTEDKVRRYLEQLLGEDRKLTDADLLAPKWMPDKVELTLADWAVSITRARNDANPPLGLTTESTITAALKKVERQVPAKVRAAAATGSVEPADMQQLLAEAGALSQALRKYVPKLADGSDHREMANLAARFLKLAATHERDLLDAARQNTGVQARDVGRVQARLQTQLEAVDAASGSSDHVAMEKTFNAACEQVRDVHIVNLDEDPQLAPLMGQLMAQLQTLGADLGAIQAFDAPLPGWSAGSDLPKQWGQVVTLAKLPDDRQLTPLLADAQAAVATMAAGTHEKQQALQALQAVVSNVDGQLSDGPPAGLALYLRQMKRGAEALMV